MDTTRRLKTPGLHPGASRRGAWREVCLELPGGLIFGERLTDSLRARAPILQASESWHRRARSIGRLFCPPMHEHTKVGRAAAHEVLDRQLGWEVTPGDEKLGSGAKTGRRSRGFDPTRPARPRTEHAPRAREPLDGRGSRSPCRGLPKQNTLPAVSSTQCAIAAADAVRNQTPPVPTDVVPYTHGQPAEADPPQGRAGGRPARARAGARAPTGRRRRWHYHGPARSRCPTCVATQAAADAVGALARLPLERGRAAAAALLAVCAVIALKLLSARASIEAAVAAFPVALVLLGLLSRGYRRCGPVPPGRGRLAPGRTHGCGWACRGHSLADHVRPLLRERPALSQDRWAPVRHFIPAGCCLVSETSNRRCRAQDEALASRSYILPGRRCTGDWD